VKTRRLKLAGFLHPKLWVGATEDRGPKGLPHAPVSAVVLEGLAVRLETVLRDEHALAIVPD